VIKTAFASGVSFQLGVFAQETGLIASWKLTPRLLPGASRVPIHRQLRVWFRCYPWAFGYCRRKRSGR